LSTFNISGLSYCQELVLFRDQLFELTSFRLLYNASAVVNKKFMNNVFCFLCIWLWRSQLKTGRLARQFSIVLSRFAW